MQKECGQSMHAAASHELSQAATPGETQEHESKMNAAEAEKVVHIVEPLGMAS